MLVGVLTHAFSLDTASWVTCATALGSAVWYLLGSTEQAASPGAEPTPTTGERIPSGGQRARVLSEWQAHKHARLVEQEMGPVKPPPAVTVEPAAVVAPSRVEGEAARA